VTRAECRAALFKAIKYHASIPANIFLGALGIGDDASEFFVRRLEGLGLAREAQGIIERRQCYWWVETYDGNALRNFIAANVPSFWLEPPTESLDAIQTPAPASGPAIAPVQSQVARADLPSARIERAHHLLRTYPDKLSIEVRDGKSVLVSKVPKKALYRLWMTGSDDELGVRRSSFLSYGARGSGALAGWFKVDMVIWPEIYRVKKPDFAG